MDDPKSTHEPLEYGSEEEIKVIKRNHNLYNEEKIKNKTRRGNWNKNKGKKQEKFKFGILGTNCNGIVNKQDSLKAAVSLFKPSVLTLQETKSRKYGNIKLGGYQIFEKLRKGGNGGGLLTAAEENISPVLVSTGKYDESEILTIQVKVGQCNIRIINGYGPQEDECKKEYIYKHWQEVEEEIVAAKDNECLVVLQTDANAKIGKEYLKNDPNNTSANGKILLQLCKRQNLTILNTLDTCKGVITRERATVNGIERSVIDYIIVCKEMEHFLEEMKIDEDRNHVLTKYGKNITQSDHNLLFSKFSIKYSPLRNNNRIEIFHLKDKKGKEHFLKETSETDSLSRCFSEYRTFEHNAKVFYRKLMGKIRKCFKVIRIKKRGKYPKVENDQIQENIKIQAELKIFLKNCKSPTIKMVAQNKLEEVEKYLKEWFYKKNVDTTKEYIEEIKNDSGEFSQLKLWKLKQKLCPKSRDPPMAKKDKTGNIITSPELLKNLYLETYQERLKNRAMKTELMDMYFLKEELWQSRVKELIYKKTKPWSIQEMRKATKSLKKNRTKDPNGMINELFMNECAGEDLEKALVKLITGIKDTYHFPEYILRENISTIYKNKGSRLDMNNDRGIFLITIFKKVLEKLIYNDKFDNIDQNMSNSNIGARKGRNVKDHLFIVYGIINSVVNGSEDSVDIQIYDLEKAFDSLWLVDCMNDAFETLDESQRDDKLVLLYESNKINLVAVNTAFGVTERVNVPQIVQQGGTWGPCLCSNSIDTIGKKLEKRTILNSRKSTTSTFKYRNTVKIIPLAMVDDILAISKCGIESIELNTYINTQIELKKLRFHVPDKSGKSKCHKLHVGKVQKNCPQLMVHGEQIECVNEDMYLGDLISSDGKNKKNIELRISKGIGIITQIMNMLEIVSFGRHFIEIGLLLRESMFINGILFNAEIWYGLSKADVNELEKLDRLLLRRILGAPISTPQEALYLELGILPIGMVIKSRRLKYLHSLLRRKEEEMLRQFFQTQWDNPVRGDWTETVRNDIKEFGFTENFNWYQSKTKETFKNIVKQKSKEITLELLTAKKETHSKMENLNYIEFGIQEYFKNPAVSRTQAKLVFMYRTRMLQFGENYRGGRTNVICPLCCSHIDSQAFLTKCPKMQKYLITSDDLDILYTDHIDTKTIKTLEEAINIREKLLKEQNMNLPYGAGGRITQ